MSEKLIVALDYNNEKPGLELAEKLAGKKIIFKNVWE